MRIFLLFLMILLSFNMALAKKAAQPEFVGTPFEVDAEFVQDFVGYDEKEAKAYEKEQKALLKLKEKRQKIEDKKIKLEKLKTQSLETCERSQKYIEELKATEVKEKINENL